jgi:CheY-like chemotaxis protein
MLRPIVEENIEFKVTLAENLGNIKVDPGHFEQVVMNLVINARDAMPHGGVLEISAYNSSIEESVAKRCNVATEPYMLLTVKDTGTGMSLEVQRRIFEPFFTTKAPGKGTGLGLSTVYGIVKQNRGLLFVESELGKGTVFKIYFPRVDEEVEKSPSLPVVGTQLRGNETVLFVEDEANLRTVACKTLEKNGYKVLTASNGIEALNTLRSHPGRIHLIITDVVMPQMGGTELASKVHEFDKDVKILFQSGYTEDTLIQNGIRTGLIHFLEKPYNIKSLLATVRGILS